MSSFEAPDLIPRVGSQLEVDDGLWQSGKTRKEIENDPRYRPPWKRPIRSLSDERR